MFAHKLSEKLYGFVAPWFFENRDNIHNAIAKLPFEVAPEDALISHCDAFSFAIDKAFDFAMEQYNPIPPHVRAYVMALNISEAINTIACENGYALDCLTAMSMYATHACQQLTAHLEGVDALEVMESLSPSDPESQQVIMKLLHSFPTPETLGYFLGFYLTFNLASEALFSASKDDEYLEKINEGIIMIGRYIKLLNVSTAQA